MTRRGKPLSAAHRAKVSVGRMDVDRAALLSAGRQRCGKCREVKRLAEFYANARNHSGRNYRCIPCVKAAPVSRNTRANFAAIIRRKYGITVEDWARAFHEQGGCCAVCSNPLIDDGGNGLHTDHDHKTGLFRGLLCGGCNTAAGSLRDDPEVARALAEYLGRWRQMADVRKRKAA